MIAVVRIILLVLFFLLSTIAGLLICIVRPFHANNVFIFSHWYGWASWIFGIQVEIRKYQGADIGQGEAKPLSTLDEIYFLRSIGVIEAVA